jgi:hypothetical protein
MELNFGIGRIAILVILVGAFAAFGGFAQPELPEEFSVIRTHKAWSYCVIMFLTGAMCVSLIDHSVGNLDRTNLRFLYVLLGIGLMAGGAWWLHTMKSAATPIALHEWETMPHVVAYTT